MSETLKLWPEAWGRTSSLTPYLLPGDEPRGAILVIPGGGYGCVCEQTEGRPIARRFNELGYHAFVLNYRVAPERFPAALQDAMRAVRLIRFHAQAWGVLPERIAACGFSAGGHLAGSLGVLQDHVQADAGDELDDVDAHIDGMILSYAVVSMVEPWCHGGSAANVTGGDEKLRQLCSLERQDLRHAPPAFVWATATDQLVNYRNSVAFAEAMCRAGRPCELRLFPYGAHGMLLGLETRDVGSWTEGARNFLETHWEMRDLNQEPMKRYTNAFQAEAEKAQLA